MPDELRTTLRELAAGRKRWPLYLFGDVGRGKTCAALSLFDWVVEGRIYATVDDLIGWMLSHGEERARWWYVREASFAVIDELGARARDTEIAYAAVKGAADGREHKPTIWISNQQPQAIRSLYDDRIFSRICCGTWYELTGQDRRML